MPHILGSSVSYRIAVGPQQGRKAFMIRTIRPLDRPNPGLERVAKANGFSLHAGVSCEGHQTDKRERLCRYIARPRRGQEGHETVQPQSMAVGNLDDVDWSNINWSTPLAPELLNILD